MRPKINSGAVLGYLPSEQQLRKSERGSAGGKAQRLGPDQPLVPKDRPEINLYEQCGRVEKAAKLAAVLFNAGIKSWQIERFDIAQWIMASAEARVNGPSKETRRLVAVLVRAKEEDRDRLCRYFSHCDLALQGVRICSRKKS